MALQFGTFKRAQKVQRTNAQQRMLRWYPKLAMTSKSIKLYIITDMIRIERKGKLYKIT